MQGFRKGVIKRIQLSPKCVGIRCVIHREALVTKKLNLNPGEAGGQEHELMDVLLEVVAVVNSIRKSASNRDVFQNFVMKWPPLPKNVFCTQRYGGYLEGKFFLACLNFMNS